MLTDIINWLAIAAIVVAGGIFLYMHWRHHPPTTPIASLAELRERLGQGRPTLIQFHAPM